MINEITVGVDIGGTNTAFGMLDSGRNIIYKEVIPTLPREGAFKCINRLCDCIKKILSTRFKNSSLTGIGIAAPGANFTTGTIESAANLQWGSVNIVKQVEECFGVPAILINDANAAALGEKYFGQAIGMKNFVVLTIGTGLGSGIVMDGQLVNGQNGLAGEMGHIIIEPGGRLCGCGRKGCTETYISANGICRTVVELLAQTNDSSILRETPTSELSAEKIAQLAYAGDKIAVKAFSITGELLGRMISNIVAALDPEAVILSGGLVKADALLMDPVIDSFNKNLLDLPNRDVKILKSSFNNGESAFLGASCLIGEFQKIYYDSTGRPVAYSANEYPRQHVQ